MHVASGESPGVGVLVEGNEAVAPPSGQCKAWIRRRSA
jgi:hypothetical protein